MRKEDRQFKSYERSERFFQTESGWFFLIRQGAKFGPYESKKNAQKSFGDFFDILQSQSHRSA